jgi:tetratricopeptide (TPR) repeat protein
VKFAVLSTSTHQKISVPAILLAALIVVPICSADTANRARESAHQATPRPGYADPAACATCHTEIARRYASTAMARSFSRSGAGGAIGDFTNHNTFEHKKSARAYMMLQRGAEYFERRSQTGFDGKETNVLEKRIDFVIGSGDHARTYLRRAPDGRLIELPVSWYAEKGGYWAMSPGYDHPAQDDFRRAIPYECMFCHNAYPLGMESARGSADAVFPANLPEGIDCQRCHGPGRAHVEAARAGRPADAIRRAIVNPARLNRDRQMDVCMQCHLETTSRKLPNSIRRFDRTPFSYRPGEPLTDYALYFDRPAGSGHDDDFEVAHQAYRLRKSACFRRSGMTCTTCHDPHQQASGAAAVAHYVSVCKSCHPSAHASDKIAAGKPAATCIDCHMPKRRTEDAVHVVMTDHYIQRAKPDRDLLADIPETADQPWRGKVVPYYPDPLPRTPANELYLAVAQVRDGANLESGIPKLSAAIAKYKPIQPEFEFELGAAYTQAGKNADAGRAYREALRLRPGYRDALVKLTGALVASGDLARAARAASEAVSAHPNDREAIVNIGNILVRKNQPNEAKPFLDRIFALDPDQPEAHNLLGLAELKLGNQAAAEKSFREAIRSNPDFAEAHNNLGNVLASQRNLSEAAFEFQKAIASDPAYIEAWRSYSLILAVNHDLDGAMAILR